MKIRRLVATCAAVGWMALPTPAAACPLLVLDARNVASADVAFVGVVTGVGQRIARISVLEIWSGPELPGVVDVVVGDGQPGYNSGDRAFDIGTRYLMVPVLTEDGLQDHVCSMTQPWIDELANVRPAGAHPPIGAETEAHVAQLVVIVATTALILVGSGLAFRRTRTPV